jgi:mycothiol system anti-sigma-R factor
MANEDSKQRSSRLSGTAFGAAAPFGTTPPWWATVYRQAEFPADPFGDPCASDGTCQSAIERLYFFLDGELTIDRRSAIQAHLDECPSCFGAFGFEAELRSVVQQGLVAEVPDSLVNRIRLAIESSKTFPATE